MDYYTSNICETTPYLPCLLVHGACSYLLFKSVWKFIYVSINSLLSLLTGHKYFAQAVNLNLYVELWGIVWVCFLNQNLYALKMGSLNHEITGYSDIQKTWDLFFSLPAGLGVLLVFLCLFFNICIPRSGLMSKNFKRIRTAAEIP